MNDLELLRLAAKAAGLPLSSEWDCAAEGRGIIVGHGHGDLRPWNPFVDDGEALRLAVKLGIGIEFYPDHDSVRAIIMDNSGDSTECSAEMDDHGTRYAIVRVAAEIGRNMP